MKSKRAYKKKREEEKKEPREYFNREIKTPTTNILNKHKTRIKNSLW